jgi:hypothetical protein
VRGAWRLLAQRGLGQLLHRGGTRCRCAHGRKRCGRAITWASRGAAAGGAQSSLSVDCRAVLMDAVETKVAACPLGRGLHSRWRADAHLSRAQGRHLRASGRCQYPPQPSSRERRVERRLALHCLAPRAREPGNSCVFLAHLPSIVHLGLHASRHLAAAALLPSSALCQLPRSRPHPAPELEHHPYHRMHLVPHHSRRLSSPYHSIVFRSTSLPRIQTLFTVYLKHLIPCHRVLHILRRPQSLLVARRSVLHCRPCHTPTHHRIPSRRTSTCTFYRH